MARNIFKVKKSQTKITSSSFGSGSDSQTALPHPRLQQLQPELESRPKSSRPRRDIDVARARRDRDFEQKLETRPRLERSETKTIQQTFETKRLQYFANIFDTKFRTFGELSNTL